MPPSAFALRATARQRTLTLARAGYHARRGRVARLFEARCTYEADGRRRSIERRTWLKGMAAGVAGAVAAGEIPVTAGGAVPVRLPNRTRRIRRGARFLDDHMRRTLTSLAERWCPAASPPVSSTSSTRSHWSRRRTATTTSQRDQPFRSGRTVRTWRAVDRSARGRAARSPATRIGSTGRQPRAFLVPAHHGDQRLPRHRARAGRSSEMPGAMRGVNCPAARMPPPRTSDGS